MEIIHSEIQKYIDSYSKHLIPELDEIERETYQKVLMPQMLSGKEQGTFLYQFISALNPKNVLELGTYTGYSAICMALGMSENATLTTLDINEEIAHIPRKYFEKINMKPKINFLIQEALPYCESLEEESLDLVFIDADKKNYPNYFKNLKKKVKKGGYILVDNVLWHGRILDVSPSKDTLAILELNKMMFEDADFICSIMPLRDGILIGKRK